MAGLGKRVIPIRPENLLSADDRKVVDLAYRRWLAKGFSGGSPEEDLLTAIRDLRGTEVAQLFLVPKRISMRCEVRSPATARRN